MKDGGPWRRSPYRLPAPPQVVLVKLQCLAEQPLPETCDSATHTPRQHRPPPNSLSSLLSGKIIAGSAASPTLANSGALRINPVPSVRLQSRTKV